MLITKLIQVGLNIADPISIYSNPESNILHILVDKYEGRCFRSCFIQKINRLVKVSECVINQDGVSCFGVINVIFEVTAIVYATGEIINGCVVNNNQKNGMIICSTDHASIILSASKQLESIQKDQKISIRVTKAKYNINAQKIAISAVPYLFIKSPMIYKMPGNLNIDSGMRTFLADMLGNIAQELAAIEQINAKSWEFFDKLLYAYNEEQKKPNDARVVDLVALLKGKDSGGQFAGKYLARDARMNLSQPTIYVYDQPPAGAPEGTIREEVIAKDALLVLLDDYYNHLRTIREMSEIYNSEKMVMEHKNLWLIFKKAKF